MSLFKTNLTATNLNVTNLTVTALPNTNGIFATNSQAVNTSVNNKIVTPGALKYLLQNPANIGTTNPAPASFTSLTCNSVTGGCVANDSESIAFGQIQKVVTPYQMQNILKSPPVIGSGIANSAVFTSIKASSISGCIANQNQLTDPTVKTKVLTPLTVNTILQNPPTIGESTQNTAKFTTLNVKGGFSVGHPIDATKGGTGFSTFTKGDLLIGTGGSTNTLVKLPVGADGEYLQTDSSATYSMKWGSFSTGSQLSSGTTQVNPASNTDAINYNINNQSLVPSNMPTVFSNIPTIGDIVPNTGTFTNVSANSISSSNAIPVSKGGLGISSFKKGDILVGNASGTLSKLSAGIDGQMLSIDNLGNPRWVDTPSATTAQGVVLPFGYCSFSNPYVTTGSTYVIDSMKVKNYEGSVIANKSSLTFDLSSQNVIPVSANLSGTVSTSTTTVTGTGTTFNSDFIAGDIITIGGVSRRIVSITSNTSLEIASALASDASSATYLRGGLCDNTMYFAYMGATAMFFSTRDSSNSQSIIDTPGGASISQFYQISLKLTIDTASPLKVKFVNTSSDYPDKYIMSHEPMYSSPTTYEIKSSSCRDNNDSFNIDVPVSQTVSISKFGQNGLEKEFQLSGTISTNGNIVTGTGTSFSSQLTVGDSVGLSGSSKTAKIVSINSDTSLTLDGSIDTGGSVTWAINGLCTVSTTQYKFGSKSMYMTNTSTLNYLRPSGLPYNTPSAWTLEAWVYPTVNQKSIVFGSYNGYGLEAYITLSTMGLNILFEGYRNDVSITGSTSFTLSTWQHVAWTYDGTTYRMFRNGTLVGSGTNGPVKNGFFSDMIIGSTFPYGSPRIYDSNGAVTLANKYIAVSGTGNAYNGYIDDIRFSNSCRYTTTFTAPSVAFTSDVNTVFLQNFEITNGIAITTNLLSALDSTPSNTYTITGPVVLNTNSKFGSSCLEFIGEGSSNVTFTTYPPTSSPWTIECWFKLKSYTSVNPIIGQNTANLFGVYVDQYGTVNYCLSSNGTSFNLLNVKKTGVQLNTWYHMALVFSGTQYLAFLNGYLVGNSVTSTAISASCWNSTFGLGLYNGSYYDGYIDEFRFSSSARYVIPSGTSLQDEVGTITWTPTGSYISTNTGKFNKSINVSSGNGYSTSIPYDLTNGAVLIGDAGNFPSSLAVWFDASDTSTLTTSGSGVTQWNDKSGYGRNATLTGTGNNPTFSSTSFNNRNGITLTGSSNKIFTFSGPGAYTSSFTTFVVLKVNSSVTNATVFTTSSSWRTGSVRGVINGTSAQYSVNTGGASDYTAGNISLSTHYVITFVESIDTITMYLNGNALGTPSLSLAGYKGRIMDTLNLGGWTDDGSRTMDAVFSEFQLYDTNLPTSTRQSIENYLMYKWGISGTAAGYPVNITNSPYLSDINSFPRNLLGWYDPSDSSTVTTGTGGTVLTVLDKSGNGNHATNVNTAASTVISQTPINGLNTLNYGSGGSNQQYMYAPMGYVGSYTAFVIFNMTSLIGTYCMFTSYGGWTQNASVNIGYSTGGLGITTPVNSVDTGFNPTLGTTYLLTIVDNGTTATMYINGSSIGSGSITTTSRNLNLGIGSWSGGTGRNFNGKFGDIQYYYGNMSTANRQAVENYFMYKWGIRTTATEKPISNVAVNYLWTLETWFYPTSVGITNSIVGNAGSSNIFNISINTDNALVVQISSGTISYDIVNYTSSNSVISANTWYHVAVSYNGSAYYIFLNGQLLTSVTSSTSANRVLFSGGITLGKFKTTNFTGYIDEFRVSKSARYTSAFTPSTVPFTVDSNTLSLLHADGFYGQGQYYNSLANDEANPSTSIWTGITSPVLTSSIYKFGIASANVSLGSGLTLSTQFYPYTYNITYTNSASFPTGLVCWYDPSDATSVTLSGSNITQIANKVSGGGYNLTPSSTGATAVTYNTAAINGLNTITMSLNGKYLTNTSGPGNMSTYSYFGIVNYTTYVANKFLLSNDSLSMVFGTHPNTSVPYYKSPAGSTSNTSMNIVPTIGSTVLLSMIDYGTYVNVYMNGILIANEPIGYATNKVFNTLCIGGNVVNSANYTINGKLGEMQIYNTAVSDTERKQIEYYFMNKWGLTPNSPTNANNTNVWTMECWFNCNQLGVTNTILNNSYGSNANLINVSITSTNNVNCKIGSDGYSYDIMDITSSVTISQSTWYHIAICYDGSKYTAYLNGTSFGSKTSTKVVNIATFSKYLYVGSSFSGYIDEFRLSNNVRYSTSFTPSNTEFTSDANTISLQHFNSMLTQDTVYNLMVGQYSSDGTTSYLNHFDLDQNINSSELTLSPVTGQSLYYRSLLANTIYYLYVSGGNTPYYMLSTKCYVKNAVIPNGLSSIFRQLPYVFITDGSKNLYQIDWEGNYGIIINSPIMTANSVSQDWNGSGYLSSHDVSALVPKISSLAMVRLKNIGSSTASLNVRDTIFNAYSNIPVYSIPLNTEATYYCPISTDQKFYMDRGSNQSFEYQVSGFYINDM